MISAHNRSQAWSRALALRPLTSGYIGFSVVIACAILLVAAAYFSPHIWRHDEAREALVIQDIVNNQRWLLPLRNQELPSKPILYHWIGAAVAMVFGVSDFTVRSPS
ncbi:MAG TPA: hypothetical protein VMT22_21405, partial [Terriglobales bacterium]|nr:hypothetical protein [Terriglobales bacterium]